MTVFAVLAHDDPALLARLVDRLAPHPVVVHVDGRRDLGRFTAATSHAPHVTYVEDRRVTNWGGWSLVEAILSTYRTVLPLLGPREQVVLLSGQCYPLRPVDEIVRVLDEGERRTYLRGVAWPDVDDHSRTLRHHVYDLFPVRQRGWRRIAHGVPRKAAEAVLRLLPDRRRTDADLVLGSQWSVLTKEAVEHAVLPAVEWLAPRLRTTAMPEEVFFPTAVHRSPYGRDTQAGGVEPVSGQTVAAYANVHLLDPDMVRTWTAAHVDEVLASDALFVRKVSSAASGPLLDVLDARAADPLRASSAAAPSDLEGAVA